jgi:hypothetical protein
MSVLGLARFSQVRVKSSDRTDRDAGEALPAPPLRSKWHPEFSERNREGLGSRIGDS